MDSPEVIKRAALLRPADEFFWGLIWSSLALFIGVVMEEIHPLNRLPTHHVNTRTRTRTPRKWVIRAQEAYRVLALVLVIAGIFGEGIFEYFGARAETAVRNFDNGIAVQAETDAGTASDAASRAKIAADGANAAAGAADASALQAQKDEKATSDELTKEIGRERTAEQQLEDEKLKRLKLSATLLPREIYDSSGVANQLLSIPQRRVVIVYLNESEPRDLAEQIAGVCTLLNWPVFGRPVSEDIFPEGVSISSGMHLPEESTANETAVHDMWANEKFSDTVASVLTSHGIDTTSGSSSFDITREESTSTLVIEVGRKPEKEARDSLRELGAPHVATPLKEKRSQFIGSVGTLRIVPIPPEPTTEAIPIRK